MKTGITISITLLFICIILLSADRRNLKNELEVAEGNATNYKRSWIWKSKRLTTYLLISVKQDSIIKSNAQTKRAAENNKELKELTQSLNHGKWKQEKN